MSAGRVFVLPFAVMAILFLLLPVPNCAEVRKAMILNFDPAVEGGSPSLQLQPNPAAELSASAKVIVISYAVEGQREEQLAMMEIDPNSTVKFVLPNRGKDDVLGVRVEKHDNGTTEAIAEWRAFYWPTRKLTEYTGSTSNPAPADFDAWWSSTKQKLAAIPMNAEITRVPERDSATGRLYKVKLNSWGNVPIIAWYFVPKDVDPLAAHSTATKYPAIQIMPGWGAEEPPIDRTADGYITLSMNPRAHGPSKEYFHVENHHLWNIHNADEYYYRAAYMDCVRGLDFLASRPEVDSSKIGVEGGSQGGAFALAMAGLDSRVAAAVANVPYLSSFPDFALISSNGSGRAFGERMRDPEKGVAVSRTLALIDVSHHAARIKCPTQICVGLQDRVCPPVNGIVALHRIPNDVPKEIIMDPRADHEVTGMMREANARWFNQYLK